MHTFCQYVATSPTWLASYWLVYASVVFIRQFFPLHVHPLGNPIQGKTKKTWRFVALFLCTCVCVCLSVSAVVVSVGKVQEQCNEVRVKVMFLLIARELLWPLDGKSTRFD